MKTTAKTPPNPPINLQQVEVRPLGGEEEKLKSSALLDKTVPKCSSWECSAA